MKRLVPAMCAAALTLSIPVAASASSTKDVYSDLMNGPNWVFEGPSYEPPANPFLDNAPNYEDWAREQTKKDEEPFDFDNAPSVFDPSRVIEVDEDEPVYHEPTYVDREYIVVAVNPKLKRYMVKSVVPTVVKMKQNVIFTQDWVVTEQPLKMGDRVWLTFDENESDGIDSDRKDGLVYVTPQSEVLLPLMEE
ncbi:hypothetical protein [Aneurinibacillus migulanus]|uniref:Uncharacterized protein n=1 Tax=Aneurinibacillus migulanus TaxID=47500 RepID=A0A0D1WFW8_ANEMI|nr:hypothetical protein [Aneurinibacillus migulanus]KIV57445.1 hypothetical protein TS65_09380 [Aneurinibacillus migulanus]KON94944.1 hypothetical protein AF333_05045 [Aneurinibacillus migulanus]MED0892768.1 hypothetical protein [Aneurinibacillus migulanus]MED1619014.1 hypothetical protein [Aneurinibacillus migulanus]SDI95060.1 hypothetical protein SAMN04487909_109200 [Aneurinibacillus migulanus]